MGCMSCSLAATVFGGIGCAYAAAPEDPTAVRAMVNAGAVELALARIDALQPRDTGAPRWAEWEGVRCDALARVNRHDALLARVKALPEDVAATAAPLGSCLVAAAHAALAVNDPAAARAHAARLLWQRSATAATATEAKAVRLSVIESYIAERRGDDAFRSMLRYQQDYQPLERGVADRFAEALIDLGMDRDALNWLGRTDEVSPSLLRLQLRGAMLTPDAVIAQARAAYARAPDAGYWRTIFEAAVRSGNGPLQIEALERVLQSIEPRNTGGASEASQRLWQAYLATAEQIGNREQLLMGEDAAWADYAARRLGSDAVLSRAFYGYLAQRAQNPDIRRDAQLQLAFSLSSAGLDLAALRIMQSIGFEAEALDPQTRYLLGTLAAKRSDAPAALKLWNGLSTPANVNALDWQLTLARTALQAGNAPLSAETVDRLLAGRTSVSTELAQAVLELGQEMLDLRALDAAQSVYEPLAQLAADAHARQALFGLGRVQELKNDAPAAAAAYLRSALLVQAAAPDNLAFQSRLLAALNLMRAGLKEDARAQFEWLVKNSKDAVLTDAAKRGLARL
ncbi:MAG: hypothetical protein JWO70_52 [Betaproteobacteria bacterium]|nr:hypothetical protein [Betaproteobacteria bacterium]